MCVYSAMKIFQFKLLDHIAFWSHTVISVYECTLRVFDIFMSIEYCQLGFLWNDINESKLNSKYRVQSLVYIIDVVWYSLCLAEHFKEQVPFCRISFIFLLFLCVFLSTNSQIFLWIWDTFIMSLIIRIKFISSFLLIMGPADNIYCLTTLPSTTLPPTTLLILPKIPIRK